MKQSIFQVGDKIEYKRVVTADDFAKFHGEVVHPVCSTFSLARDMEWTTRQFVLKMRDEHEEGVGTFVNVEHVTPAFEGEEIIFAGYIDQINGNELICTVKVSVADRLIAIGKTGQKIIPKEKLDKLFKKR